MCRKKQNHTIDENRKAYQKFFGIEGCEQYLIYQQTCDDGTGYIVFIDNENDLDYIDKRDKSTWSEKEVQMFHNCLGKLQQAEVSPCHNLKKKQLLAFKQILGRAYLQILEKDFSSVDLIIGEAENYLRKRNLESARELVLSSAGTISFFAAIIGITMYFYGGRDLWIYGILFGILGAFFSIWTRYGKEELTGLASKSLYYLESISRLFIGAIASVIVMFAIRGGLMFAIGQQENLFFIYCVCGFAAGFSERLIPTLIEKIVSKSTK